MSAMDSPLTLNFLWAIPITIWLATRNISPIWRSTLRGASFGAIVSPASLALYGLYFLGPLAAILGMLGLVINLIHGSVGYEIAVQFGLARSHAVVNGPERLLMEIINGLIWSVVYGSVCFVCRYSRIHRARKP
jgi:hypothetical protein